ncbi:MAG: pantetheine-phosphate adenylyltransferase [Alphaproteobacteria bacterium]|jgi:pantetheine-phosphate adenylyltransferase|nr:pantetheine-phosphate adenylyltransferase [Alphaproteobacteria bacterium]
MANIALYPGTFDPLTYGHLDMITRASMLCSKLVVGVAENPGKNPLFSLEQRKNYVEVEINKLKSENKISKNVEVRAFKGLLTDFAKQVDASMLVRGLRAVSDFEYEFQMASANKRLHQNLETVFLTASEKQHFVASRLVKEIARYGGDVSSFVPEEIMTGLTTIFQHTK